MPCARSLEADWATHGHVMRARDCHVVVTWSAALWSCDNILNYISMFLCISFNHS